MWKAYYNAIKTPPWPTPISYGLTLRVARDPQSGHRLSSLIVLGASYSPAISRIVDNLRAAADYADTPAAAR